MEYNTIYFSKGGKISKSNPCVEILVFKKESDIDGTYISGRIHFDTYLDSEEYSGSEYEYFVKDINKYFKWQNL